MKKSLLTTLSLLVCVLAMADPISSKRALEIATSYLAKSGAPRRAATQMSVQPFQTDLLSNRSRTRRPTRAIAASRLQP